MSLLSIQNMDVSIGQYSVLHGVTFDVPEGGVFVLLGRNGAGKTTTLRAIMGLWQPSPGSVSFRGEQIAGMHTSDIAKKGIAFVPENMGIFGGLTVAENMVLATANGKFDQTRLKRGYELFPALEQFWDKQAWSLSGGQKQMLAVARAIIEPRDLILIDEPTKGLAPSIIAAMGEAFREISAQTTILLVEQNFRFAAPLADRHYVIEHGQVVEQIDAADLEAKKEQLNRHLSV